MLVYEAARSEAKEIRDSFPLRKGDTDYLVAIARARGANVIFARLRPGISGMIDKGFGEDPTIYINVTDSSERQRFTLAHEIGHLIERQKYGRDDEYTFTDYRNPTGDYNLHEFFADEFAGELLMPDIEFLKVASENGTDFAATARHFQVSPAAARRRLTRLVKNPPREVAAGV